FLEALKRTPLRGGTTTCWPVLGFRPWRCWRCLTRKVPKLEMTTFSSLLSAARIVSKVVSTALAASPFVDRTFATALMISSLFIAILFVFLGLLGLVALLAFFGVLVSLLL